MASPGSSGQEFAADRDLHEVADAADAAASTAANAKPVAGHADDSAGPNALESADRVFDNDDRDACDRAPHPERGSASPRGDTMQHEQPAEQPQALDPSMQTAQADQVQKLHHEQQLENEAQREAEQGAHQDEPEVAQAQERPQQSEQQRSEERQLPEQQQPAGPLQQGDERMERVVASSSAGGPAESPRPSPRSSTGPTLDEIYKSIMVQKVCSFSMSCTPSVIACVLLYSVIHCGTAHPAAELLALGMPLQRCCLVCLLCLAAVATCTINLRYYMRLIPTPAPHPV